MRRFLGYADGGLSPRLGGVGQDVNIALASRMPDSVRLCTYDRANVGQSGQQPGRHTGDGQY